MVTVQKRPTAKQQLWLERVSAWEKSGLSQAAFCKKHELTYGTFIYWRSHLKKLNADRSTLEPVTFFPVTVKADKEALLVLQVNKQYRIELRAGFDANLLVQVIQTVQQMP